MVTFLTAIALLIIGYFTYGLFLERVFGTVFMTMVCTTFILIFPEGFRLAATHAYLIGGAVTAFFISLFFVRKKSHLLNK